MTGQDSVVGAICEALNADKDVKVLAPGGAWDSEIPETKTFPSISVFVEDEKPYYNTGVVHPVVFKVVIRCWAGNDGDDVAEALAVNVERVLQNMPAPMSADSPKGGSYGLRVRRYGYRLKKSQYRDAANKLVYNAECRYDVWGNRVLVPQTTVPQT
jgi:hypothetical protein